jgi:hypothetical protein
MNTMKTIKKPTRPPVPPVDPTIKKDAARIRFSKAAIDVARKLRKELSSEGRGTTVPQMLKAAHPFLVKGRLQDVWLIVMAHGNVSRLLGYFRTRETTKRTVVNEQAFEVYEWTQEWIQRDGEEGPARHAKVVDHAVWRKIEKLG